MLTNIFWILCLVGLFSFLGYMCWVQSQVPSDPNFRENWEEREYYENQGWAYPWSSKAERIRSQDEQQRVADEEARLRYESLQFFERQNRNHDD